MSEIDPIMRLGASGPEVRQEPRGMVVTGLYKQEKVDAMSSAAELDRDTTVDVIDPNDDSEFRRYAGAVSKCEHEEYGCGDLRGPAPQTPEELQREIQPHAIEQGLVPVIVRHAGNDLSDFWARQQEILAQREEE